MLILTGHRRGNESVDLSPKPSLEPSLQSSIDALIKYALPENYNFEIHKTIKRARSLNAKHIALQFPEGLLMFAPEISHILETVLNAQVTILGDVSYGACCVDDLVCEAIGVDLLVHYGHSCLIPIVTVRVNCLYVFVSIDFDEQPLLNVIQNNDSTIQKPIALLGTIQYSSVLAKIQKHLKDEVTIPQCEPLTPGEVLGCTSPTVDPTTVKSIIFVADGRFHLESTLIANPTIPLFRYDPFTKRVTRETYDHVLMMENRRKAIQKAKQAKSVGLILGTLGRQGSVGIFERLKGILADAGIKVTLYLMSELAPHRLLNHDAYIQVACPRLSIDWHSPNDIPLLTAYEAMVAYGGVPFRDVYPMDYYAKHGGPWTNYQQVHRDGSIANPEAEIESRRRLIQLRIQEARQQAARQRSSHNPPDKGNLLELK